MSENLFWLSEAQMERLRPHLPDKVRGVPRVDDRRVISGIVHVLKSGCRWVDAPAAYGPRKTLYNRWRRWAEKGHWVRIFEVLADADVECPPFHRTVRLGLSVSRNSVGERMRSAE